MEMQTMPSLSRVESIISRNATPDPSQDSSIIEQVGTHLKKSFSLKTFSLRSHTQDKELAKAAHNMSEMVVNVALDKEIRALDRECVAETQEIEFVNELKFTPCSERGLSQMDVERQRGIWGKNELPSRRVPQYLVLFRLLTMPMPIMLWIVAIIEGVIENFADMGILLGIQLINATIAFYETTKAADAVDALKAALKPRATCHRDGAWVGLPADELVPGDLILLAAGAAVPADCSVNRLQAGRDGPAEIEVDQSAMTGESLPARLGPGDLVKMGSVVKSGEVRATVHSTGTNTYFGRTALMIQTVESSGGSLERLLLQIMVILVGISVVLCSIALAYLIDSSRANERQRLALVPAYTPKADSAIVKECLSFAVVLLVASVPVAIEIVTTTTLAVGSRLLSEHGAIVTKLAAIEELAGMDMLCTDKTGTLTLNRMEIQEDCPIYVAGEDRASLLLHAALATKWREPPRDALDAMVLRHTDLDLRLCEAYEQINHVPFDARRRRTEAMIRGPDGRAFLVTKGAPDAVLELCLNDVGAAVRDKIEDLAARGIRCLAVARQSLEDGRWLLLGLLTFLDPPRPDARETILRCRSFGVEVKMVTGDHVAIAREAARRLGMGDGILVAMGLPTLEEGSRVPKNLAADYGPLIRPADGFAQVYPEHKYLIVECLRKLGFRCGMTGDGVNDAPALKRADVGIAVQGSTDAAQAAADIVLTRDGLNTIVVAIGAAREIFCRLKNFICYRLAATLQLLVFFFVAVFAVKPIDYYRANFCPTNLVPTSITSCDALQMPAIPTLLSNGQFVDW